MGAPSADAAPWPSPLRAWIVVGLLMVAYTSSFIDRQIMSLLVEPIRADLGITDTQFSLLAGLAFSIFYSVMGLPLGWLADRMSRRMIILVGMIAWSIMTALCGLATSFLALFIARVGVGIGEAALSPAAYSLISDYFPPERRARAISAYAMGPYLGSGLALIIGGQVIEAASRMGPFTIEGLGTFAPWQAVFFAVGLPGVIIALLFLLIREPERRGSRRKCGYWARLVYRATSVVVPAAVSRFFGLRDRGDFFSRMDSGGRDPRAWLDPG